MIGISMFIAALIAAHAGPTMHMESSAEAARALLEVGLSPRVLAAAGASAEEAAALIARVDEAAVARATLAEALEARSAARSAHVAAVESARSDPANRSLQQAVAATAAALAAAEQSLGQAVWGVRAVAVTNLPAGRGERIAGCRQAAARRVPAALSAATLSESDWDRLELSLIAERRAHRLGEPLAPATVEFLAQVRAQPAVVQAQLDVDRSLAAIETLFGAQ